MGGAPLRSSKVGAVEGAGGWDRAKVGGEGEGQGVLFPFEGHQGMRDAAGAGRSLGAPPTGPALSAR